MKNLYLWFIILLMVGVGLSVFGCTEDDGNEGNDEMADNGEDTEDGQDTNNIVYVCTGDFCDDVIDFCEWTVPAGCNGYDDHTVQSCIDAVQTSFPYCGYPNNLAICMADCVRDFGDPTCTEYDDCFDDHECSWFGDC